MSETSNPRTIVVVGNGMVGHRFVDRLTADGASHGFRVILVGEESRAAYDRVHLTDYFVKGGDALVLPEPGFHEARGIELRLGVRVVGVDRDSRTVSLSDGTDLDYDALVLATGSSPFVPPLPGIGTRGVHVYRTIEDLDGIRAQAVSAKKAIVIGGGLLGLEAARAVQALGLASEVVEMAPRLLPRQLDDGGSKLLERTIRGMGIGIHLGASTKSVVGEETVTGLELGDGTVLSADMIVVSAGIRPRDELARASGLALGERGGIAVDDGLATSDPAIFAIGECASHRGMVYGLVAPGYDMADVLARRLRGEDARFEGADLSTRLKLLGTDVASVGDPFVDGPEVRSIVYQDLVKGVYKKLVLSADGKLVLGAVLVGDASDFGTLLGHYRTKDPLPEPPESVLFGAMEVTGGKSKGPSTKQSVCSCNNVTRGALCSAIRDKGLASVGEVKKATSAGTGCGGCLPLVTDILQAELAAMGNAQKPRLCEHFDYTRTELFEIVRVKRLRTFEELLASHGSGLGCEICKPTVASILASIHNEWVLEHATLQDTNDRFLANIQRKGLYSVVPRIPGGEITPEKLIVIGEVAKKYGLYTKITGGQRIDLFGARVDQLPDIWEELVEAGFESGHAYGKALRTVKSCVGSTWCRYGVQDSVGFAVRVEERYKGLRAPHKLKSAVSGCVRECAEAQSKDFGLIATEKGYNLYVCGNGGAKPRHADLLASDLDEETALRFVDRFLMFYVRTADRLTRTSVWLEKLEGGIDHLRDVVVNDSLGIAADLERDMQAIVDTYQCEWASVVRDPEKRAGFGRYATEGDAADRIVYVEQRGQLRPADWVENAPSAAPRRSLPVVTTEWVRAGLVRDIPADGGIAIPHGQGTVAVFRVAATGALFATENACPHTGDEVLARGLLGDASGVPKVACPHHKKTFALETGACLSDEGYAIETFPTKLVGDEVWVELPPAALFGKRPCANESAACSASVAAAE
ncbi:MAG: nitrite reductase large subunit NirB [Polyangiales bacterium]